MNKLNRGLVNRSDQSSSIPSKITHLNACFVPFDERNPYQRQLATQLRLLGVNVAVRSSLKGLVLDIVRGIDAPKVIHLHWLPRFERNFPGAIRSLLFGLRLLLLRSLGRRIVWTVHNLYAHEAKSRRLEQWIARRVIASASSVITHSETARRLVTHEFSVHDKQKVVVVPHGNYIGCYENTISSEDARSRLQFNPESVVILFFGNIRPYKGVPELIEAYQQLEFPSSSLVIAGRPLNQATVSDIEQKIASSQRIKLRAGFIPDAEVQKYMNACDVVVFPYQDILTSGAVILAMSFGRACIAPALGCIPDVLDERGAFLYDPGLPDGLRKAMEKAIQNRARLKEMGKYNRKRAEEWSWERIARETAIIYTEVLSQPNKC